MLASFWPFFFQAGGTVLDEEGNLNLDSEATLEAPHLYQQAEDRGHL